MSAGYVAKHFWVLHHRHHRSLLLAHDWSKAVMFDKHSSVHNTFVLYFLNSFPLLKQVDTNRDRLVSLDEFLIATKKKEFLEPDSWEVREVLLQNCGDIVIE